MAKTRTRNPDGTVTLRHDGRFDGTIAAKGAGIPLSPGHPPVQLPARPTGAPTVGNVADAFASFVAASQGLLAAENPAEVAAIIEQRHPGVKLSLYQAYDGHVVISKVSTVPEARGKGLAGKAMRDLIAHADAQGWRLTLTPSKDFGSSKPRLEAWYRSLGFLPNKGRTRVPEISEAMVRPVGGV